MRTRARKHYFKRITASGTALVPSSFPPSNPCGLFLFTYRAPSHTHSQARSSDIMVSPTSLTEPALPVMPLETLHQRWAGIRPLIRATGLCPNDPNFSRPHLFQSKFVAYSCLFPNYAVPNRAGTVYPPLRSPSRRSAGRVVYLCSDAILRAPSVSAPVKGIGVPCGPIPELICAASGTGALPTPSAPRP